MMRLAIAAALVLLIGADPALACQMPFFDPTGQELASDRFGIQWRFVPTNPKVGEFFSIDFSVCSTGVLMPAEQFKVEAMMPAHRHGMNFVPKITMIGHSIYRAEGLMFHMPGVWALIFEYHDGSGTRRLITEVEIE